MDRTCKISGGHLNHNDIKYNLSIILFQLPIFFLDCSYHCNISVVFVLKGKKTDSIDLFHDVHNDPAVVYRDW